MAARNHRSTCKYNVEYWNVIVMDEKEWTNSVAPIAASAMRTATRELDSGLPMSETQE